MTTSMKNSGAKDSSFLGDLGKAQREGTGEMTQWARAQTVFPEEVGPVPSTHTAGCSQLLVTPV